MSLVPAPSLPGMSIGGPSRSLHSTVTFPSRATQSKETPPLASDQVLQLAIDDGEFLIASLQLTIRIFQALG